MNKTKSRKDTRRENLITFKSLLFRRMAKKYGGTTTLNELTILNYGYVCHTRGEHIYVAKAVRELQMAKSTVSRILAGMRARGIVTEELHPSDGRRRMFRLTVEQLDRSDLDFGALLDWCAVPENSLA